MKLYSSKIERQSSKKAEEFQLDRCRVIKTVKDDIALSPDPFSHWTVKEIFDQPVAIQRALGYGSRLDSDLSNLTF